MSQAITCQTLYKTTLLRGMSRTYAPIIPISPGGHNFSGKSFQVNHYQLSKCNIPAYKPSSRSPVDGIEGSLHLCDKKSCGSDSSQDRREMTISLHNTALCCAARAPGEQKTISQQQMYLWRESAYQGMACLEHSDFSMNVKLTNTGSTWRWSFYRV